MNLSLFLKTLVLSFSLEGGLIPGHEVSMYQVPQYQTILDVRKTYYSDMSCNLDIYKYFYLTGGITSYQWGVKTEAGFYPFRMDYQFGTGVKYKAVTLGYYHGCRHHIAPNVQIQPFPRIDSGHDQFFVRLEIKKKLFE